MTKLKNFSRFDSFKIYHDIIHIKETLWYTHHVSVIGMPVIMIYIKYDFYISVYESSAKCSL